MKKGYGALTLLFCFVAWAFYDLRQIITARGDAAELSNRLEKYLEQRFISGDADSLQAISFAEDIDQYLSYGPGAGDDIFGVVVRVILTVIFFDYFQKSELGRSLKTTFVRIWTWRP